MHVLYNVTITITHKRNETWVPKHYLILYVTYNAYSRRGTLLSLCSADPITMPVDPLEYGIVQSSRKQPLWGCGYDDG